MVRLSLRKKGRKGIQIEFSVPENSHFLLAAKSWETEGNRLSLQPFAAIENVVVKSIFLVVFIARVHGKQTETGRAFIVGAIRRSKANIQIDKATTQT